MGAREIIDREFEMVLRGYKTEDVKAFLREVSFDFSRMQKENEDFEKKLEVLANKIREYREDEDTLKDALLGAQRQGNALIADSKRKAAEIIEEAQASGEAIAQKAEEERLKKKKQGEDEILAAQEKAADIIAEAKEKAAEIEQDMNLRTDVQKEILHRTSDEVAKYKVKILEHYKKQLAVLQEHYDEQTKTIEAIAGDCENEFIRDIIKEERPFADYYDGEGESDDEEAAFENSGGNNPRTNSGNGRSSRNTGNRNNRRNKRSSGGSGVSGGNPRHPKFETTDVSAPPADDNSELDKTVKFEIDVDDDYADATVQEIFGENSDDTGELPFYSVSGQVRDNKPTSEIVFKKG